MIFCNKPFQWIEITSKSTYICCPGWNSQQIGNLDIWKSWNSESAQNIRSSILNGSFEYCNRSTCPYLCDRKLKGPVKDISEITDKNLLEIIKNKQCIIKYPTQARFSYDESCNLYCLSCRNQHIIHKNLFKNFQNKLIKELIPNLTDLQISGNGDPFASPTYWNLLTNIKTSTFPNLKIDLWTNGLLFTEKKWNDLKDIRCSIKQVNISIDAATESTYEQIRRGGNWSTLLNNLEFISELRKKNKINKLNLRFVVQSRNWKEMLDFVNLGIKYNSDEIIFAPIRNWLFSNEEYLKLSVHLPSHPCHRDFCTLLSSIKSMKNVVLITMNNLIKPKLL